MEFRQLQTFMIIAQTESFSKAAELLGYSQSAVTVQIRLLEKELDTRLFERMGRKIALTAQGQNLRIHAGRILEEMSQAEAEIRLEQELCSPLHVGVIESLFFTKLPPILGYFRQHYPKVSLKLTTGTPKELIEHMEYNQLDLIYILDRPRYNNHWSKEMEKKEDIVFVTNPKLTITQKQDLMVEDLLYNPFFLTEKNENYRKELDQLQMENQRNGRVYPSGPDEPLLTCTRGKLDFYLPLSSCVISTSISFHWLRYFPFSRTIHITASKFPEPCPP